MRVLGIDPGTTQSAYLLLNYNSPTDHKILEFGKIDNSLIFHKLRDLDYNYLVIEGIVSYGMPIGQDTLRTLFTLGRFYEYSLNFCEMYHSTVFVVSRQEIKMHHCKATRKVNDGVIRQALIDKYGPQGVKKTPGYTYGLASDTWSAFAIATYFAESKFAGQRVLNLYQD